MPGQDEPWVLGISASHNGAACLMKGQRIVVAIQEERLLGKKRARLNGAQSSLAVRYCLDTAGIGPQDLDAVVLCAQVSAHLPHNEITANPDLAVQEHGTPTFVISHHAGHAISGFATSGFEQAAVLIVDGMGSPVSDFSESERAAIVDDVDDGYETTSLYLADGMELKALEKHLIARGGWLGTPLPDSSMHRFGSLGGMYSAAAGQVFGNLMDAGKIMGLAPYGEPNIPIEEFLEIRDGRFLFCDRASKRFNHTLQWPSLRRMYQNLSASVQETLEHALMYLVHRLRALSPHDDLVYAGGVALNSVANERIIQESGFRQVHIMPPAEDSGPAIGAAYYGLWKLTGCFKPWRLRKDALGRTYDRAETVRVIEQTPAVRPVASDDVPNDTVDLLIDKQIVGWFEGPSELGPRALGQRSILCDPRRPDAKKVLNSRVKHREAFRPFAPVVLLEEVENWFELDGADPESPFMLRIMKFKEDRKDNIPAVVHVDGTGRVQTVTREVNGPYYDLVRIFFEKTGVPILINTSFNVMGEPIVETPEDALWCLLMTDLDYCVLEGTIVTKKEQFRSLKTLYPYFLISPENVEKKPSGAIFLDVETPWGPSTSDRADPREVLIVEALFNGLLDGRTRCEELFGRIRKSVGPVPEQSLIRLMAQLRRTRVISFAETPHLNQGE